MKKWNDPEIVELNINCTELGKAFTPKYDSERVDENGDHWYSFSGESECEPQ